MCPQGFLSTSGGKKFDAGTHCDIQNTRVRTLGLRDFLNIKIKYRFSVIRQCVRPLIDLNVLFFTCVQSEECRCGHKGDGSGGVIELGIYPGLNGKRAFTGVGDNNGNAALMAVVNNACAVDGECSMARGAIEQYSTAKRDGKAKEA